MSNLTNQQYWNEVNSTANYVITLAIESLQYDNEEVTSDDVMDRINDYILHEQIDSHQYAIYYAYHLPILQYSDNAEYMVDNFDSDCVVETLKQGLDSLHAALAFWAFYADVMDNISENDIEDQIDELGQDDDE